eukprot:PhM_4_TR14269/c1_g1_i1/m.59735
MTSSATTTATTTVTELHRKVHALEQRNHKMSQQLTVKQQELDALFAEATTLDGENRQLSQSLKDAQGEVARLTLQVKSSSGNTAANSNNNAQLSELVRERNEWQQERQRLMQSVRDNQRHVQEMIDLHTPKVLAGVKSLTSRGIQCSSAPPQQQPNPQLETQLLKQSFDEQSAELAQLRTRLANVERSRATLAEATEAYKQSSVVLQKEAARHDVEKAELRRQLDASEARRLDAETENTKLQAALQRLGSTSAAVVARSEELERMDHAAKQGLRGEWDALREDNTRLQQQLAEAVAARDSSEDKFSSLAATFDQLRNDTDEAIAGLTREVGLLNKENLSLTDDFARLRKERDALKTELAKAPVAVAPTKRLNTSERVVQTNSAATSLLDVENAAAENRLLRAENESLRRQASVANSSSELVQRLRAERDKLTRELETEVVSVSTQHDSSSSAENDLQRLENENAHLSKLVQRLEQKVAELSSKTPQQHRAPSAETATAETPRMTNLEKLAGQLFDSVDAQQRRLMITNTHNNNNNNDFTTRDVITPQTTLYEDLLNALSGVQSELSETLILSTSTMQLMLGQSPECREVPLVPCDRHREGIVNVLYEHVGGLKHTTRMIRREAVRTIEDMELARVRANQASATCAHCRRAISEPPRGHSVATHASSDLDECRQLLTTNVELLRAVQGQGEFCAEAQLAALDKHLHELKSAEVDVDRARSVYYYDEGQMNTLQMEARRLMQTTGSFSSGDSPIDATPTGPSMIMMSRAAIAATTTDSLPSGERLFNDVEADARPRREATSPATQLSWV